MDDSLGRLIANDVIRVALLGGFFLAGTLWDVPLPQVMPVLAHAVFWGRFRRVCRAKGLDRARADRYFVAALVLIGLLGFAVDRLAGSGVVVLIAVLYLAIAGPATSLFLALRAKPRLDQR